MRWLVSPVHRLEITSSLIAGVSTLARSGELSLALEPLRDPDPTPHITRWDLGRASSGSRRKVAFDEFDRSDRFDLEALREVDVYFKRTYHPAALEDLPPGLAARVRPGGLTFGCFVDGSRLLMARAAWAAWRAQVGAKGLGGLKEASSLLFHNAAQIEGFLNTSTWERHPSDPLYDRIVYQTRIWSEEPDPEVDRHDVNAERVAIVRALRAEFQGEDLIGLIHTDFAEETAPDALLGRKVSRVEYAQQLRTSLIAVNSHGLDGSAGFKVGESLAAGCALVSQPFRFELPEPLLPEVHYLPFETPEECVAQCRRLLADRDLASRMRAANQAYYRENVKPEAHARGLLERTFTDE